MADVHAVIDHSVQSLYSDPRQCAGLFDEIEPTVEAVSAMARNVVVHYRASGRQLPEQSREDISLRWVDAILATDPRLADPTDIPPGSDSPFLTAAHVWRAHRAGTIDVTRFGVAEGLGIDGDWFVHGYVIAEVAHRFGDELLLWDTWGAMSGDLTQVPPDHITLVDEIAQLLTRADERNLAAERELLSRYRDDDRLHPGPHVRSISPNGGSYDVDLSARTTRPVE